MEQKKKNAYLCHMWYHGNISIQEARMRVLPNQFLVREVVEHVLFQYVSKKKILFIRRCPQTENYKVMHIFQSTVVAAVRAVIEAGYPGIPAHRPSLCSPAQRRGLDPLYG